MARHDAGKGKLLSPAQAWNSPHDKFPDEFREFSDAIEADIADLHYENGHPWVYDEDDELEGDSTEASSSDDEKEASHNILGLWAPHA